MNPMFNSGIDDASLVDALDDVRQSVTPELLTKLEEMLHACEHYAARGSKADAALVDGMRALLALAMVAQ